MTCKDMEDTLEIIPMLIGTFPRSCKGPRPEQYLLFPFIPISGARLRRCLVDYCRDSPRHFAEVALTHLEATPEKEPNETPVFF